MNQHPRTKFVTELPEGYDEQTRLATFKDRVIVSHPDFKPLYLSEIAQCSARSPEPKPSISYGTGGPGHVSWGHFDGDERWWDDVYVPGWVLFLIGLGAGFFSMFMLWLVV